MMIRAARRILNGVVIAIAIMCVAPAITHGQPVEPGVVRLAMVTHGGGLTGRCFSTQFLTLLGYESTIRVDPSLAHVDLDSDVLFDYPLAIITGEGPFSLSASERSNMRRYVQAGGTLLVSSGCSNALWANAMRDELATVFPATDMAKLDLDHELFSIVFDVADLVTTQGGQGEVWGLHVEGRLAVVFSPHGLNDTASAGGACCCCGGNEIRQAKFINANLVAYALAR